MDSHPSLRIHIEEDSAREERVQQQLAANLPEARALAQQFESTTGWVLNYRAISPPTDALQELGCPVFGRFQIADLSAQWPAGKPAVSRAECEKLLTQINRMVERLELLAVKQHQAQTTLIEPTEDSPLLPTNAADKVANLLRFAKTELRALGAAVYLLDEATTHLRLRSMIAPVAYAPEVDSVRALENSLADLEALIGNRVNIQSVEMGETWRIPQPFRYGWCVMLGSKSLPLGTIWLFFSEARVPQASDLTLLDGLAAQLQSEISSREKPAMPDAETALLQQELILAARSNDARLPAFAPEIDGWKIAGWTYRQGYLSSTFHDWSVTPSGNLSVAVGQVVGPMLTSAMSLNNLRSLISAHRDYRHTSETLAAKLNEQIWCHSPGDEMASLIYALVDPETDQVNLINSGDGGVVFHGPQGVQSIDQFFNPLGVDLDSPFEAWNQVLEESQTIVMFTQGLRHAISETIPSANDADLLRTILLSNPGQPQAILAEIEERFFNSDFQHVAGDLSVIVLSRSSTAPDLHHIAAEVSHSILAELRGDDRDILIALEDSLDQGDDWDQLSDPATLDRDAAEFDQHWSTDLVEPQSPAEDGEQAEGEPDEEIEPDSANVLPNIEQPASNPPAASQPAAPSESARVQPRRSTRPSSAKGRAKVRKPRAQAKRSTKAAAEKRAPVAKATRRPASARPHAKLKTGSKNVSASAKPSTKATKSTKSTKSAKSTKSPKSTQTQARGPSQPSVKRQALPADSLKGRAGKTPSGKTQSPRSAAEQRARQSKPTLPTQPDKRARKSKAPVPAAKPLVRKSISRKESPRKPTVRKPTEQKPSIRESSAQVGGRRPGGRTRASAVNRNRE